ncbi:MAG TPA: hypothetical protein DCL73_12685 [Treponema sp.]|nr:hypothetical protein [Treponema sp.]
MSAVVILASCRRSNVVESVDENELFSIPYGNFEDQLNMFDLTDVGNIHTTMTMRDGFFYIANGEAGKIMELNSYGDLLTLYYNEDSGSGTFTKDKSKHMPIAYPFNSPGAITVDSRKYMYVVSTMPKERQEEDETGTLLYSQIVLRFSSDGTSNDYIGQQGVGGTPFPFIRNIYTTSDDELVVVCTTMEGAMVYWFSESGFLMYKIPIVTKDAPKMPGTAASAAVVASVQDVVPDYSSRRLFVKIDYYQPRLDKDSKAESGIDFVKTFLFPLSVESGKYESPITIPPYEETVSEDYSKLIFKLPYDFLGVSKSGWLFFIISTSSGFNVEMVQPFSQKIIRRHLDVNHNNVLYYSMALSDSGIISALLVGQDRAKIVWWRTDSLTAAILKS